MKSRYKYRFWLMSLAVHLCLAIVFSLIAINQINSREVDALNVSILKVKPIKPVEKLPYVKAPISVPIIPMPDIQIERQIASAQSRALTTHPGRSASVFAAKATAVNSLVSQSTTQAARAEISVQGLVQSSRANRQPAQPLATAVDLPLHSNAPLTSGVSGGGSLSEGVGGGFSGGHRVVSSGSNVDGTRESGRIGLTSLIGAEGAANIDDALSDVADKVALGGGMPELPHGIPGAIVVGRGRNIMGRLNLARFEDPLHPSADI